MTKVTALLARANTGYKEFRIHGVTPQSRTRYLELRISVDVDNEKSENYKKAFSCIRRSSTLNRMRSDIVSYMLTPQLAIGVIINLLIINALSCFNDNGLSSDEATKAIKDGLHMQPEWGDWG
jgi:hypothetical protein